MSRSHAGFSVGMVTSVQRNVPTTGQTVSITQTGATDISVIIEPAGLLATLTVTLPVGNFDGQRCSIMSTAIVTLLTINAAAGGVIGGLGSLALNGFATYVWVAQSVNWYRIG